MSLDLLPNPRLSCKNYIASGWTGSHTPDSLTPRNPPHCGICQRPRVKSSFVTIVSLPRRGVPFGRTRLEPSYVIGAAPSMQKLSWTMSQNVALLYRVRPCLCPPLRQCPRHGTRTSHEIDREVLLVDRTLALFPGRVFSTLMFAKCVRWEPHHWSGAQVASDCAARVVNPKATRNTMLIVTIVQGMMVLHGKTPMRRELCA